MRSSWLLIIAAPPALVAFAVALDSRSRRGYGLGLLAAGAIVLDVWGLITFYPPLYASAGTDNLGVALTVAVYLLIVLYVTLALMVGAIVETLIARQWRWLAIIVTVSLVPAAIILVPAASHVPDVLGALGFPRSGEAAVLLLSPALVTFAYALARIIRRPLAP